MIFLSNGVCQRGLILKAMLTLAHVCSIRPKIRKKEILAGSLQKIWSLWPWPSSFSPPFLLQKCQRTERRKLTMRNDTACWSDENGYA